MSDASRARCRHVWVDTSGGGQSPGLVIAWRHQPTGWEAYVAVVRAGSVLVTWEPAAAVHRVVDDRFTPRAGSGR